MSPRLSTRYFFFNDTATTEIYTLSLHDALPISLVDKVERVLRQWIDADIVALEFKVGPAQRGECVEMSCVDRSEEHTSELQSRQYLVCRLLLEKKKNP